MKPVLVFFLVAIMLLQPIYGFPIGKDSITIELSMLKKRAEEKKQLSIELKISSYQKRIIEIPKEGDWGYLSQNSGFFSIIVQKKVGQKYIDIPEAAHIDDYPEIKADTIHMNESRLFSFPIHMLYHYEKGQYRVKVLVRFSSLNSIKDHYSNWFYFECSKELG